MAQTTTDMAAQKARKQKIILAVAGVMLALLAALQVPKLTSSGGSSPAAAAQSTEESLVDEATAVANDLAGSTGAVVVVGRPAGYVAGVALPAGTRAPVSRGQLAAFTLFETKDPFVQQVSEESASTSPSEEGVKSSSDSGGGTAAKPAADQPADPGAVPGVAPSGGDAGAATTDSGSGGSAPGVGGSPAAPSEPYAYATMMVNGNPELLEVKKTFPEDEPVFVLVGVTKNAAQIGVAGGSLEGGKPATVKLGKKLTLVNSATGERWVLKLVYTGSEPETLETFSTASDPAVVDASAP